MLAASTDSTAALKMLLEAGADIHATDDVRCSALLRLCKEAAAQQYMSPRMVTGIGKIVTESAAATPRSHAQSGNTSLAVARSWNRPAAMQVLIEAGATTDAVTLKHACAYPSALGLLASRERHVNARVSSGTFRIWHWRCGGNSNRSSDWFQRNHVPGLAA